MQTTVADRIKELVSQHGSLRAVARATGLDVGYLSRLCSGKKLNPSDKCLQALGLKRLVSYNTSF